MYNIHYTNQFKKDYKLVLRRGNKESIIKTVVSIITKKELLPSKYKQHKLSGKYVDCWECHLTPDWLLIWQIDEIEEILTLIRTGSHSDLF